MFKSGEIIGKIIEYLPGGKVLVDYAGTLLTLSASDNEYNLINNKISEIESMIAYHGTSAELNFNQFNKGVPAYFATDMQEAVAFATNRILGGGRGKGEPRILKVILPKGKVKDIDDGVQDVIMGDGEDEDLDVYITKQAEIAKNEFVSYLTFYHPGVGNDDFKVYIAVYPENIIVKSIEYLQTFESGGETKLDETLSDEQLKTAMDNFDWSSMWESALSDNTVVYDKEKMRLDDLEERYQQSRFSKSWAATFLEAKEKLVAEYFSGKRTYDDWAAREYKTNKGKVWVGDEIGGTQRSIGSINDHRRQRVMRGAQMTMKESVEDLIRLGLTAEEIIESIGEHPYKAGGQVNSNTLFDINQLLGFSIEEFMDAPAEKLASAADVQVMPLDSIYTDEARFQNRDQLNQQLVDDIAANWSDANQDPVHIWEDPKDDRFYVLSGHHRYYGAKKADRKNIKITDRTNDFTEAQAIKYAKEEANANRTMETALERAKALRVKRQRGDSRDDINKFLDREGKNKNYINNISFLSPSGKTLKTLEQFGNAEDKQLQKETEQRSDWIGEARRTILGLTDAHENELFDFIFDKSSSKRVSTKAEFLQKVRSVVNPMQPDEPLNIARFKLKTQGEAAYEEMVNDKKAAIAERQDKINQLNDRFTNPYSTDFISTESQGYDSMRKIADNKISQLDVERKILQKQLEDIYRDKMKYTAAQTSGSLFLNFKSGGEIAEINDLLGFSIDEFIDFDKLPVKKEPKTDDSKTRLQDYGEKIGGAKKDLIRDLNNITSSDLITQPLSKVFPQPDYKKLFESGLINRDGLILLKYMYDNIPTKPRKSYRVPRWMEQVEEVLEVFRKATDGTPEENNEYTGKLITRLRGLDTYKLSIGITTGFELYFQTMAGLDFPVSNISLGNYRIRHFSGGGWRTDQSGNKVPMTDRFTIVDTKYIIKDFPTLEEAVNGLRLMLMTNKEKSKSENTKFSIYQDTKTKEIFIGKKGALKVIRIMEGFSKAAEAQEFLKNNQAELQGIWDGMRDTPEERREQNRPRIGVDWRGGKDITSEDFAKTFGFRGIEFGNWVNSRERQTNVNDAYDALMDMASIIGISPAALALSGELGLAFGARGSGRANAHYERDKIVINLTKTRGSGSLAHEWWHALDNYFSRMRGLRDQYITDFPRYRLNNGTGQPDTSIRILVLDAYKGVMDAINKSNLKTRSEVLDSTRSKQYWSTPVEMSARAFEGFIIEKLSQTDQLNDYLANFKEMGDWIRDTNGNIDAEKNYPYPLDNEADAINLAYQQFFETLQVKKVYDRDVIFESGGKIQKQQYTVRDLASMMNGEVTGAIFSQLNIGDSIKVGNKTYTLTTKSKGTAKERINKAGNPVKYNQVTIRLKDDKGGTISGTLLEYENGSGQFYGNHKWEQISRDMEGDITVDLINENNNFHKPSDFYKYAQAYLENHNNNFQDGGSVDGIYKKESKSLTYEEHEAEYKKHNAASEKILNDESWNQKNPKKGTRDWDMGKKMQEHGDKAQHHFSSMLSLKKNKEPIGQQFEDGGLLHESLKDVEKIKDLVKGTKVADKQGNPIMVYHGTASDLQSFEKRGTSGSNFNLRLGDGFYFTEIKGNAINYANEVKGRFPKIINAFLDLKNPLEINSIREYRDKVAEGKKQFGTSKVESEKLLSKSDNDILKMMKYDGIILKDNTTNYYESGVYDVLIVFKPDDERPDTMNTGYAARVQTNMDYIGSKLTDWKAVPITGFVSVPGPGGKMIEMPEFDFPKGYKQSKTLYPASDGNPCCELCGKSPIKRLFHIQNDSEKTTLITGSECVAYFGQGKSGKENLRAAKLNLAILIDNDLNKLAKFIKKEFSYLGQPYGWNNKRNTEWKSAFLGKHPELQSEDYSVLQNPKTVETDKRNFSSWPEGLEEALQKVEWRYIYSMIPVFSWPSEQDLVKRNYESQESAEKKLLTWFKKNEQNGRMLLEKITKILKVLDKYDENVLNSEYLSAVNAGEITKISDL